MESWLVQKKIIMILKLRYSEKATKIWPIFHSLASNYKEKMGHNFVVFSEYLNFKETEAISESYLNFIRRPRMCSSQASQNVFKVMRATFC